MGDEVVVRPVHQRLAPGEVAVQDVLVAELDGDASPSLRRQQGQQIRVHPLAGARCADEQEAAVEQALHYRAAEARAGRGARDRPQGLGVPHPAQQVGPVTTAQQRRVGVEQLADRSLEQHVAVVEQHLAAPPPPPEAERVEGMERGRRMKPGPGYAAARLATRSSSAGRTGSKRTGPPTAARTARDASDRPSWRTTTSPSNPGWWSRNEPSMTTAPGTNESVTTVARHTSSAPVRGKASVKSRPSGARWQWMHTRPPEDECGRG